MTVRELKKCCEDVIESGFGDYKIAISNDEEGNGYHDLFYQFTTEREEVESMIRSSCTPYDVSDVEHTVILG